MVKSSNFLLLLLLLVSRSNSAVLRRGLNDSWHRSMYFNWVNGLSFCAWFRWYFFFFFSFFVLPGLLLKIVDFYDFAKPMRRLRQKRSRWRLVPNYLFRLICRRVIFWAGNRKYASWHAKINCLIFCRWIDIETKFGAILLNSLYDWQPRTGISSHDLTNFILTKNGK